MNITAAEIKSNPICNRPNHAVVEIDDNGAGEVDQFARFNSYEKALEYIRTNKFDLAPNCTLEIISWEEDETVWDSYAGDLKDLAS
jgi:hypothetical protein